MDFTIITDNLKLFLEVVLKVLNIFPAKPQHATKCPKTNASPIKETRTYLSYTLTSSLQNAIQDVRDYFSSCQYKEVPTTEYNKITIKVDDKKIISLCDFDRLDSVLRLHPVPEELFLHAHWLINDSFLCFRLTVTPIIIIVTAEFNDSNIVAGIHEHIKLIFKASEQNSQ